MKSQTFTDLATADVDATTRALESGETIRTTHGSCFRSLDPQWERYACARNNGPTTWHKSSAVALTALSRAAKPQSR